MLAGLLDGVRDNPWPVLTALALGILLGLTTAFAFDRGDEQAPAARTVRVPAAAPEPQPPPTAGTRTRPPFGAPPAATGRRAFEQALERGMAAARRLGGEVEAAVWVGDWPRPIVRPAAPRRERMWSLSKPATAIAVLRAKAAQDPGRSAQLDRAIEDAIVKSSNCAQRRVVLGLQQLLGIEGARAAFRKVLADAGARVAVLGAPEGPEPICHDYLRTRAAGIADPLGRGLLLGTVEWTVADAVRFAHALGAGTYGPEGRRVLDLMRKPKKKSPEALAPDDFTARLAWGAGRALRAWRPAYKGGWGGKRQGRYLASQLVTFDVAGTNVAIAVTFRPRAPVSDDDPGKTVAPQAIEAVLRELARVVARLDRAS